MRSPLKGQALRQAARRKAHCTAVCRRAASRLACKQGVEEFEEKLKAKRPCGSDAVAQNGRSRARWARRNSMNDNNGRCPGGSE
jgi:hypothetical protein